MSEVNVLTDLPPAFEQALNSLRLQRSAHALLAIGAWSGVRPEALNPDCLYVAIVDSEAAAVAADSDPATFPIRFDARADTVAADLDTLARASVHVASRLRAERRRARRALAELQSTRDLLGRLIDATPNPVMAADMRGRVIVFNHAAEVSLGYESKWARGHMHVSEVYAEPEDSRRVLSEIRSAPDGLVQAMEVRLRTRTGEHIPVLLSAAEVYAADGMPLATVGVFEDQRKEVALRNRLEQTTEQLIASETRAAAVAIAGSTAHELNQPLTTVMGSLELLELRRDLPEDVHHRLQRTYGQLERMAEIVRELADTHSGQRSEGRGEPYEVGDN